MCLKTLRTALVHVFFLRVLMMFCKFYFMYELREGFTILKMNITTKASKFMSEISCDVRKSNLVRKCTPTWVQ